MRTQIQKSVLLISALVMFSLPPLKSHADEASRDFELANLLYQKQNYDSAALLYEKLLDQEYQASEIYYNLANCYYKTGKIAPSILNYERALRLNPNDEDAAFNLKIAQLKVVDKIETVPEIFYRRWLKSVSSAISTDSWSRIVILCIWISFIFGAVYLMASRTSLRRAGFLLATFFLMITFCAWLLSQESYANNVRQKSAIVTSVSAYVKSSPGDSNTDLFILHEGTKVSVQDTFENWVKVRIANGSIGWLKSTDIEEI